jgi:glyoxylase-like metal-dependent hydrolase (beta-lactamase superfamily II)
VDVVRIAPRLWRWTGYHEEWKEDVGSVYWETDDGVVLIDPLVPPEDRERFWHALDRDIERVGGRVHVLVTVFWHTRSAAAIIERYDAQLWAPSTARAAVARRAGEVTHAFRPNDPLPGGIGAFRSARRTEVLYWIPQHAALVPGDVLIGDGSGGVTMCPESWLPGTTGHSELAASLLPLLELPVQRILLSHGEPVLEGGSQALRAALAPA